VTAMSRETPSILTARQPVAPPRPATASAPAALAPPRAARTLDFTVERQAQSDWCWAAVSASVARFYEAASTWSQCTIVNLELGQQVCCSEGSSTTCNQPHVLESALALVKHLGREFEGPLAFADIATEIDAGRPIGLCIDWTGGGGHFVTVAGYDPNGEMIEIEDPLFGASEIPLRSFPASYQGGGTWSWTYLTSP
jgi:Papain-like cysteine protease AvrRpt2